MSFYSRGCVVQYVHSYSKLKYHIRSGKEISYHELEGTTKSASQSDTGKM